MNNKTLTQNNIQTLLDQRDMSARVLAKKIGTSAPHMSRLIRGQSPLTMKWILKISSALKIKTSEIVGLDVSRAFTNKCDDMLLGSIMGWLMEAADDLKIKLSREDMSKLTSFVYKEAVEQPLDFGATRYLALTAVQIKKIVTD